MTKKQEALILTGISLLLVELDSNTGRKVEGLATIIQSINEEVVKPEERA